MHITVPVQRHRLAIAALAVGAMFASGAQASNETMKAHFEFKKPKMIAIPGDVSLDTNGISAPVRNSSGPYVFGFEGISQYDGASLGRNAIPPDTIGAVGKTQYFATTNGAYAVYDKYTGQRTALMSDNSFWQKMGLAGTAGDTRVMYNASADRWIAVAFGTNVKDLQIAVSDTHDALGGWKGLSFEGYKGLGFGGAVADYPTLALDKSSVYIGTNNFAPRSAGAGASFTGTTLNVIPINSLFGGSGPSITNMKQFETTYTPGSANVDGGFALQGVNSFSNGSSGTVLAASMFSYDSIAYRVNGLTADSAAGASKGSTSYLGQAAFEMAGNARQPAVAVPGNRRVVTTGDERISSSVYEVNGRIYSVQTVNSTADGLDEARVRYTVIDSQTFAIIDEGDLGKAGYDAYMGSIAVNASGQVVIGYNQSGLDPTTGKISFMARTFNTGADGKLIATSEEILLKESLTDDYHNGSTFGNVASGRQRWGDYSQVSVDPTDIHKFYLIGEFAREYNNAAGGHPGGTGGSRWGTWVAVVDAGVAPVPEPSTYGLMLLGLGVVGFLAKRRQTASAA